MLTIRHMKSNVELMMESIVLCSSLVVLTMCISKTKIHGFDNFPIISQKYLPCFPLLIPPISLSFSK